MTELEHDLGTGLRLAREQSDVTLRQIAEATKHSVRNLTALETNRIDQLPGGIYRRAIVRSYASQVGLDPEATLQVFLKKYPDDVPKWDDLLPPARPSRRVLQTLVGALSALIPLLAGGFYFAGVGDDSQHVVSAVSRRGDVAHAALLPASFGPTPTRSDRVTMMVSVSAPTALQIVADGLEVVARRVVPGEVVRLSLDGDVILVGDNAGAVHFSINGRAGRALGEPGETLTARISRHDYHDWLIQPQ